MADSQPLDLAPIQARLDAAAPGPWSADGHEIYQGTPDDYTRHSLWIGETCNIDLPDNGDANGAFLAAARQDVPNLIREVENLRAALSTERAVGKHLLEKHTATLTAADEWTDERATLLAEAEKLRAHLRQAAALLRDIHSSALAGLPQDTTAIGTAAAALDAAA